MVPPSEHLNEPQLVWRSLSSEGGNRVKFSFGSQSTILILGEHCDGGQGEESGPAWALACLLRRGKNLSSTGKVL